MVAALLRSALPRYPKMLRRFSPHAHRSKSPLGHSPSCDLPLDDFHGHGHTGSSHSQDWRPS